MKKLNRKVSFELGKISSWKKGIDMSKKKKDGKSSDHRPKTWAKPKSGKKGGKYNGHMMYHIVGMTTRAMKMSNDC